MGFHPSMKRACWAPQILVWKRNCTELNYYEDEYIKYFCPKTSQTSLASTYMCLRVLGIRKVVEKFVNLFPNEKVQFVNLGAGLDTVSFWLLKNFKNVVCYDSDLEYQVKMKVDIILKTKELLNLAPNYKSTESTFSSERYNLFPCDLTNIDELNKLKDFGFSDKLPTLYLNEFTFMFVPNNAANELIKVLHNLSNGPSVLISQELASPFSFYMKWYSQFNTKTAPSYSLHAYPTKESHVLRYKSLGWEHVFVHDLTFVYNNLLDKNERSRLRKIENFNDLRSLALHSCHTFFSTAASNFHVLPNFSKLFEQNDINPDSDDELLPCYTEEELEMETDIEDIKKDIKNMFDVTFSEDNDECRSFFNTFV